MTLKEAIQKDGQRHLYVKSASTLKEMVLCFYLTEFVREFLCKLERKSSYFSYIILCASAAETRFSVTAESNGILCIPLQRNIM